MATYNILWKPSALKELKVLNHKTISKIIKTAESLAEQPLPRGTRKIKGCQHSYRIRIGDYRVIYSLYSSELVIEIIRVRHRKDAY